MRVINKFLVASLLFFVCGSTLKALPPPSTVKIGTLLCLTGNCADWGSAALNGANLALAEVNGKGGVLGQQLELIVEDTRESVSGIETVTAFKKLSSDESIHFFIGPSWSPGALALAPIAARRNDLLIITPSASAEAFSRAAPTLFNMRPPERIVTKRLAEYALHRGWKRAAILTSTQPATMTQAKIFREAFAEAGGEVVRYVETNPEIADVKTETLKVVNSNPDVIFLMAYLQLDSAALSLRALGYKGSVLVISIDEARVANSKGLFEGFYVGKSPAPKEQFSSKYQKQFGQAPGLSAENGFDAIIALAHAIKQAGTFEIGRVAKNLSGIEFEGASGKVSFDKDREALQEPFLYQVLDSKLKQISWE